MLYIFKKTLSDSKSILYSLTAIYGINKYQSKKICKNIGINPQITLNKLKKNHVNRLTTYISKNLKIEQLLKKAKTDRLNELVTIKSNRGIRQSQGLPVRGQRTHTNARTSKKLKKIFIQKRLSRNKRPFNIQKKNKKK
uniref:ribosomal protein S13 n=1 Tax=Phytophthora kernoviae TaxID=325452 RepID=UPI0020293F7F|nr:ribosomal protein S13 [Phytophthora kernoviae]UXG56220.1 ribosomal protein S13 [Phytophthora kernoviae]DAZ88373.1 TPA_asm: ribosomal protein S13 [Phytophthora kernoviae]DAZ88806.1 TPA_asm: ribosomal protein S13 [Phytophthora kernoviae]